MFESINEAAAGLKNGSQTGKSGLSVDAPILLFPLRTEVKFMDNELLVRVYPEAIAIEQHEEQLTKAECQAGIWYWENLKDRVEKEIKPKSTHLAIWKTISDNFGAQRAEWIVQQCRPQNWEESPDGAGLKFPKLSTKKESWSQPHTCRVMPQELTICLQADQGKMIRIKSKNTIPEKLQVGPDPQKMKTAQKKDQEFVVQGANNAAGDFSLAGEIAWMTDFEEAVKKGVGFRIPLPEGSTRIEWLFVFGVKTVDQWWTRVTPSEAGLQEVLRLLRSHYYTPAGLSLMPQGEPTKNTEQKSTASALPLGFEKHHFTRSIQSQEPAATAPAGPKSDQQMLADALGIPFDSAGANELKKLRPNYSNYSAGSYDYHEAQAMNTALFPATVGYFTELVLGNPFGAHQAEFRDWFNQFVTGRGPLPVLKRGNQPYAVLPVTYFPDLAEHQNFPIFQRIAQKTDESLEDIILNSGLSDISTDKDMAEKLANILFQHPASVRHWLRFAWLHSTNYRAPELKIDKTPILKTSNGEELDYNKTPIEDILSNYFDKLPATDFGFQFTAEALVELPLVTSQALSEEDTLPTYVNGDHPHYFPILDYKAFDPCNYIEWIRRYYIIYCGHELREEIPKKNNGQLEMLDPFRGTLLIGESTVLARYLMHAILSQVHKCAVLWLKEQGDVLVDRFKDIVDQYRLKDIWPESNVKTPFVPLDIVFAPLQGIFKQPIINDFTKNINDFFSRQDPFQKIRDPKIPYEEFVRRITVAEYIYYYQGLLLFKIPDGWTPALRRELEYLETLKSSLNTLAQMPTARLERCLVEHFDVLSYRMDAWRTAFCFEKLSKDRQLSSGQPPARPTTSKGLHIGAYGWLLNIVRDETKRSVPADDPALQALGIDKAVEWKSGGGFVHAPSLDQAKAGAILKSAHTRFKNLYPDHPEMFAVNLSSARVRQGLYLLEGIQQGQDLGILLGYQFEREMHDGGLDHLIQEFRKEYSYQAGKLEQFGYEAGQENLATAGTWPVVDGLALLKAPPPNKARNTKKSHPLSKT